MMHAGSIYIFYINLKINLYINNYIYSNSAIEHIHIADEFDLVSNKLVQILDRINQVFANYMHMKKHISSEKDILILINDFYEKNITCISL